MKDNTDSIKNSTDQSQTEKAKEVNSNKRVLTPQEEADIKSLKEKITAEKETLKEMSLKETSCKDLTNWGREYAKGGMLFNIFKQELKEIGIDYDKIRQNNSKKKVESLKGNDTAYIHCSARNSKNRFSISTPEGKALWYGSFYSKLESQSDAELDVVKKAIWLIGKLRDYCNLDKINIVLYVDTNAKWLTWANHWANSTRVGGKARKAMEAALKQKVHLSIIAVDNSANKSRRFLDELDFKRWNDCLDIISSIVKKEKLPQEVINAVREEINIEEI